MKKLISILLAVIMLLQVLPMNVLAEELPEPNVAPVSEEVPDQGAIYLEEAVSSAERVDYGEESFYLDGGCVYRTDYSETTLVEGLSGVAQLAVCGEFLYYTTENDVGTSLFRYDLRSRATELVRTFGPWLGKFCLFGTSLYYRVDSSVMSCDLVTGSQETLYVNENLVEFDLNPAGHVLLYLSSYEEEVAEDVDWCGLLDTETREVLFGTFDEMYAYGGVALQSAYGTDDWSYATKINGKTIPFPEYGKGSYFTDNGEKCGSHKVSTSNCKAGPSNKAYGKGWQCLGFAYYTFNKLFGNFGGYWRNSADYGQGTIWVKKAKNVSAGKITASYLKNLFNSGEILPGAHIRTNAWSGGWGHSLIYIGHNDSYFWTYEGNADGHCGVYIKKRTWNELTSYLTKSKPGIEWIETAACKHNFSSNNGICSKCGTEFYLDVKYENTGIYTNRSILGLLSKISVYKKPYTGVSSTKVSINSRFTVYGTVKNGAGVTWYSVAGGYIQAADFDKLTKVADHTPEISISGASVPSGSLKKGDSFPLKGTVKSAAVPIQSIEAAVVATATGKKTISYTVKPNAVSYSIAGSTLDNKMTFGSLPVGEFYLIYTVKDAAGGVFYEKYDTFTVTKPNTVASPSIKLSSIDGGRKAAISCSDKSATIHYRLNGGSWTTVSASSGKTLTFTDAGSCTISAYTTRSGYTQSPTVNQSFTIAKADAPVISGPEYAGDRAYATISGSGIIYYTTDGSVPTESSTKYAGAIALTGNCTIRAICKQSGGALSGEASKDIVIAPPAAPQIAVEKTKIARGDSAAVSWKAVDGATAYLARLFDRDGNLLKEERTTGTKAAFQLNEAGEYTITAAAVNAAGESETSNAAAVTAMADLHVRFLDFDGTVLSYQDVRYGEKATQPQVPPRTGYQFNGWDGAVQTPLYADTDFTAQYQINKYTVRFKDADGTVLSVQRVPYESAAIPPEESELNIPAGYRLAGWCVENSSEGLDYTCVTEDMDLTASYQWGNLQLPVVVDIRSATYVETDEGPCYECTVTIKNNDQKLTRGRLVAVVQTSDGRTIETHVEDVNLPIAADQTTGRDYSFTINSGEVGTVLKAVVLGVDTDNDDKTGGAYSAIAEAEVKPEVTYSDWSGWSTAKPPADAAVTETATQYRYRTKKINTVTDTTLGSPWTLLDSKVSYGAWSAWSKTAVTASATREVETRSVAATYKTQYRYFRYSGKLNSAGASYTGSSTGASWSHFCGSWAKKYMSSYSKQYTPWLDSTLSRNTSFGTQVCSCCGKHWGYKYDGKSYYAKTNGTTASPETRKVEKTAAYTEYRYRTVTTTNTYWMWGDWSAWTSTPPASYGSYDGYETQTLYRYKTKTTGAKPIESENTTEVHEVSGKLDPAFAGKLATALVYKKTNTDPTQSQLEYVDQITIGNDGSYAFTLKAKEALDAEQTGDFVISLALEGASRLVNVDVIEAPLPSHTVSFYLNGQQLGQPQEVLEGHSAVLPEDMEIPDGYVLTGWDESISNVTENLDVHAVLQKKTYTITFVDWENSEISTLTAEHGQAIPTPENPTAAGRIFLGWDKILEDNVLTVTEDLLLTARWEAETLTVVFEDGQGNVVETQEVAFGMAATLPTAYAPGDAIGDYIFAGWSNDTCWWEVTGDTTVFPILLSENTLVAPLASLPDGAVTAPTYLELFATEPGATVYYTTDSELTVQHIESFLGNAGDIGGSDAESTEDAILFAEEEELDPDGPQPDPEIFAYTDPIALQEDTMLYVFQVAQDGTVSDIGVYDYMVETETEFTTPMGDANLDGVVDTLDVTRIANYLVGAQENGYPIPVAFLNADTSGDGELNVLDVMRLMRYLAGWDVQLGQ